MRNLNYTKKISQMSMYYVETRADNSGYTNHRYLEFHFNAYHNYWEIVFLAHSKLKRGYNSNKMLGGVVFSCQQIGFNTFYKCIEIQVNSFDSYWGILIILKKYPKFLCTMSKQEQITLDMQITGSPALL